MTDKIELQTQPANGQSGNAQQTIEKLEGLVKEYQQDSGESTLEGTGKDVEGTNSEPDSEEYDYDGFKVPSGKIPIDGHFTSKQVEQLVSIAQKEGLINEDVGVEIIQRNENFGDKVVISEKSDEDDDEEDDKNKVNDKEDNEKKDEDNANSDEKKSEQEDEKKEFKEHYLK